MSSGAPQGRVRVPALCSRADHSAYRCALWSPMCWLFSILNVSRASSSHLCLHQSRLHFKGRLQSSNLKFV